MGREEPDAASVGGEAVKDGVSDGHAVVGRSAATELVEDNEGARGGLRVWGNESASWCEGKEEKRGEPFGESCCNRPSRP